MHCLNLEEYLELLKVNFYNQKSETEYKYIHEIFESCKYWDQHLIGINYFFSIVLEKLAKDGNASTSVIDFVYQMPDYLHFEIQEIDYGFIDNLFSNFSSSRENNLIDEIIEAQTKIYE